MGKKLLIGFAAMLILTLLVGIAALSGISRLSHRLDVAISLTVRKLNLVASIRSAGSDMLAGQRGVVMFTYAKRPEDVTSARGLFTSAADQWAASLAELRPLLVTEEGKRVAEQLESSLASWRSGTADLERLAQSGDGDGAARAAINNIPIYQAAQRATARLTELQNGLVEQDKQAAADLDVTYRWGLLGVLGLALAIERRHFPPRAADEPVPAGGRRRTGRQRGPGGQRRGPGIGFQPGARAGVFRTGCRARTDLGIERRDHLDDAKECR